MASSLATGGGHGEGERYDSSLATGGRHDESERCVASSAIREGEPCMVLSRYSSMGFVIIIASFSWMAASIICWCTSNNSKK